MSNKTKTAVNVKPVGEMVLIFHDQEQGVTPGGILLPDTAKEQVLTGRIVAMPERMKDDALAYPYRELDNVIYDIRCRIPVQLSSGNRYYLVEAKYIYGVISNMDEEEAEEE